MTTHDDHPAPVRRPPAPRWRTALRFGFGLYTALLLVGLLWPRLRVESDIVDRPDLLVHLAVFGLFQMLLTGTGLFGRPPSIKNTLLSVVPGAAFAAVTELAQGIPALGRTSAPDDLLANLLGIGGATAAWSALAVLGRGRSGRVEPGAAGDRSS